MKKYGFFLLTTLIIGLSSCIEIVDDLSLNDDGSGSFKYTVNLSSSKVKISSILALDSLDGKKIPSRPEIEEKMDHFLTVFQEQNGISNAVLTSDYTNYIFKLKCDFESVAALQSAIKGTVREEVKEKNSLLDESSNWLSWTGGNFARSIPEINIKKTKSLDQDEIDLLKQGNYISITRFQRKVNEFSNAKAILAKNKLAVMLKTNVYSLSQNPNLLENTIYLSPLKP